MTRILSGFLFACLFFSSAAFAQDARVGAQPELEEARAEEELDEEVDGESERAAAEAEDNVDLPETLEEILTVE